jgi:hypothetical protein
MENVFERHRLQFGAAFECVRECRQRRLNRLAAERQAIQEARTIEILDAGNAGSVGLRFQVASFGELRQRQLYLFKRGWRTLPVPFELHLVRTQVQTELALCGGKGLHDYP